MFFGMMNSDRATLEPAWQEGDASSSVEVTTAVSSVNWAPWGSHGMGRKKWDLEVVVVLDVLKLLLILGQGRIIFCVPWFSWLPLIKTLKQSSSFKDVLKCFVELVD